jgi:hypothetical protein
MIWIVCTKSAGIVGSLDRWIVVIKPLPGTRTNEARDNIQDPRYAKFRADKLKVLVIFSVNPLKRMRAIINKH